MSRNYLGKSDGVGGLYQTEEQNVQKMGDEEVNTEHFK